MVDELTVCAAAFFLNKGKDVIAKKEFTMGVSLDLRWMTVREAESLVKAMLSAGVLELKDDYLRPNFNTTDVDVPLAYRPSPDILKKIQEAPRSQKTVVKRSDDNVLVDMIALAEKKGMRRAEYMAACNSIQKGLDVDIEVAGLMVLKNNDVDVSGFYDRVRKTVISK